MITKYVVDTFNIFKQDPSKSKDLYKNLITEEYKEFIEAKSDKEKISEAIDLIWMCIGYIISFFKGDINKVFKAFKTMYLANVSKVCYSEEDAIASVEKYKKKGVDVRYKKYVAEDFDAIPDGTEYWIIYDKNNKYKKGINFEKADYSWVNKNI
jgi:hypothetical protein